MPYTYSDHLGVRTLNSSINDTTTTIPLDALPSKFADDVEAADNPRFPIRIGGDNRASHERVVCTGVNRGSNELVVERDVKFGKESHNSGTRVAHPFVAETADVAAAKQVALPEPWEPEDFLKGDAQVAPTVDQVLTHYPWEDAAGISKIPRFLLDVTRIEKIPNALQRNHVRTSKATRWDASGDLVEDSADTLRLQRDPKDQSVLGLLYEPKRTQILGSPQDVTSADWSEADITTTANVGSAKNQNYDEVTETNDGSNTAHFIQQNFSRQTEGDPIGYSCIVKANGRQWCNITAKINDDDNSTNNFPKAYFDLSSGAVGSTGKTTNITVIDHSIDDLGNGWYRCNFVIKPDSAWAAEQIQIVLADGDLSNSYQGDGSSGIYIMHAQAEVSREVTTPILQGGGVREADEVDYRFSFPDKTTGVAYSIRQESGGDLATGDVMVFGTTSDSFDRDHGVLMWGAKGFNHISENNGWKQVTRNSNDDAADGTSPLDETIDRFQVNPQIQNFASSTFTVRQIAIWTQPLTSAQKSDLDSNYLTAA